MNNVWSEVKKCDGNAFSSNLKTQISKNVPFSILPVPILESKGMRFFLFFFFSEKGQERTKKSKIFENLGKYVQNLKII